MTVNCFPNDGCAIVCYISRISIFFFAKVSPLFQFEIAFSDIWIFLAPKGDSCETPVIVEKQF